MHAILHTIRPMQMCHTGRVIDRLRWTVDRSTARCGRLMQGKMPSLPWRAPSPHLQRRVVDDDDAQGRDLQWTLRNLSTGEAKLLLRAMCCGLCHDALLRNHALPGRTCKILHDASSSLRLTAPSPSAFPERSCKSFVAGRRQTQGKCGVCCCTA